MYQTRSGYDRGVNTFSPEGRLFQVEYAIKAIELGSCAIGVQTAEGIVLGVERRVTSPLLMRDSIEKIMEVDTHIAVAISGLTADANMLIDHARVESQYHRFTYAEPMAVDSLTQSVCDYSMRFGEGGDDDDEEDKKPRMSRPFGVSLLVAGYDEKGPQLYHTDPSGTMTQYAAHAIGNGAEGAISTLQDKYSRSMSLRDGELLVLRILKDTLEERVSTSNVQLASVVPGRGLTLCPSDRVAELLEIVTAEAAAHGP